MSLKLLTNAAYSVRARLQVPHIKVVPFRQVSANAQQLSTQLPPRPKIREEDITENFIKGGGTGGQKINKTNSLVQILHHPTGLTIKCQATRSRSQNRTLARRILAERIEELEKGDESRTRIKELKKIAKKKNSAKKKKRKYRKLEENDDASSEDKFIEAENSEQKESKSDKDVAEPLLFVNDRLNTKYLHGPFEACKNEGKRT